MGKHGVQTALHRHDALYVDVVLPFGFGSRSKERVHGSMKVLVFDRCYCGSVVHEKCGGGTSHPGDVN